jgi:hypothetical protein
MTRTLLASSLVLALAAGCAYQSPTRTTEIVPQAFPFQPGTGVVQAVTNAPAPMSAAAGASAPGGWKRLLVRMDNGVLQYVDTESNDFAAGSRVELTGEGLISPR